ncbi:hypothetical protein A4X13_0g1619 [Tilletia indica]|uniref:Uncharacterized protein n=1 Tax=Tilletia indica TaxID=43049 RepID=A0A177TV96_9BASI|nr:hypothetical protein A4X13_0g1619 [Tilletia indica]
MTGATDFIPPGKRSAANVVVRVADGAGVPAVHSGNVDAVVTGKGQHCLVALRGVLAVPGLDANLLSTNQLAKDGFCTIISHDCTLLVTPSGRVLVAQTDPTTQAAYFQIRLCPSEAIAHNATAADNAVDTVLTAPIDPRVLLLHRRWGHTGVLKIKQMIESGALRGKDVPSMKAIRDWLLAGHVCDVCVTANQRRAAYPKQDTSKTTTQLEKVFCDIMGPFIGHKSFQWVLTLVDSYSRKTWVYCLPDHTADTLRATLEAWAEQVEVAVGQRLATIHTDNGMEFVAEELQDWAKERGTSWTWTAPHSSSQNGVAERRNGLLEERMRAMLRAARLPLGFWPYAVQYAAYVLNRTPSNTLRGQLPQEVWSGKPAKLDAIRTFGSLCWTLIYPKQRQEGKLSARGLRGIFLGIGEDRRAWLVFCPSSPSNSLRWSRSVVFDESRTYDQSLALEEPKPIGARQDDHVEMTLAAPKEGGKGRRKNHQLGAQDSLLPIGIPSDEDLQLQEYQQAGEVQVLEPPGLISPPPDETDLFDGALVKQPSGMSEHGEVAIPLWEPPGTETSSGEQFDVLQQVQELERYWETDKSTPSSVMSLDDLSALLDQTPPVGNQRTSTPPPLPSAAGPPRRSARIQARFAHGLLSVSLADEEQKAACREMETAHASARSAVGVLGMALHWAFKVAAQGTSADGTPLEPQNLKQAKQRPLEEWRHWKEAMDEEIGSLVEMKTWELVELPKGRDVVGSRWVYKLKLDRDGRASRYKGRLVAQGFTQRDGIDFSDTFAPVARLSTIRIIISLALALSLNLGSIDIKTAYLNGKLQEEVYMQQPPEYDDGTGRVCLLRRAIYGLKQAGRAWFDTLKGKLLSAGYTQIQSEPCLFVRFGDAGPVILAVYVDDIVIAARGKEGVDQVKKEFASWFKITDNGELSHILGMRIDYDASKRTATLTQTAYIESLLRKYKMEHDDPLPTPMTEAARRLGPNTAGQASQAEVHDFAALIGSLLWAVQGTRLDAAFAVGHLARFIANPSPAHFLAAKRILRFLLGTKEHGLKFTSSSKTPLKGWSDSDHGTDPSTRRSVSGYVFQLYGNTVSWRSRLQATVSISSTEAEYMALSEAAREAKWIRAVLSELGVELIRPTEILTDSKGAEAIAKDPAQHGKTKHIEIHHHLVRQLQERKEISVGRVHTDSNPADMLTKAASRDRLVTFSNILGLGSGGSIQEGVGFGLGSGGSIQEGV